MTRPQVDVEVPERMRNLPRNKAGYLVPWFVAEIDGEYDFRVIRVMGIQDALMFKKCWLCGEHLGKYGTFVIGPMCAVNRVSSEPPSHKDCAEYAVKVCPFLTTPNMTRRENRLPDDAREPAGNMIRRNPGVTLVWTSKSWEVFRTEAVPQAGVKSGILFDIGDPESVSWWAESRPATRREVEESINSGLPELRKIADLDPRSPTESHKILDKMVEEAWVLLPEAS